MELELSEDQSFFQQTTRKFLTAECPLTTVRGLESHPDGWTADYWTRGAELGWTSMLVPEADGGGSLSQHALLDLVFSSAADRPRRGRAAEVVPGRAPPW